MKSQHLLILVASAAVLGAAADAKTPPAAASGFAVVDSTGALVRGNALSAARTSTGIYVVTFDHPVKKCVFTATTGSTTTGTPPNGYATVAGFGADPSGMIVATYDVTGVAADYSFHLNVRC